MTIALTALALSLGLTSCATTSSKQRTAAFKDLPTTIVKGKSTRAEVLAAIGEPDQKRLEPTGETWIYGVKEGSTGGKVLGSAIGTGLSFIPYAGNAWGLVRSVGGSRKSSKPMAAIQFSSSGVVQDYSVTLPQ